MAAKDVIHDPVKMALIKDGWTITHDPYPIETEEIIQWKNWSDIAN
jgi:hypothetical protein